MLQKYDASMDSSDRPPFPELILLASSYTPFQPWEQPLSEAAALEAGTVFPSLVKPFMMAKGGEACEEYRNAAFGFYGKG